MPTRIVVSRDEERARQAAAYDEFTATNPIYKQLHELIHQESTSAADCAKFYAEKTTELANGPERERELSHFIEVFAGSLVHLAAYTPHGDSATRTKLVEFVGELKKTVVIDPKTGQQLIDDGEALWTDLPMFRLHCSEEMISFDDTDPDNIAAETERWKNLSAFWASLTQSKISDFSGNAYRAFEFAFDTIEDPREPVPRAFLLQTACIWLVCATDTVWRLVQEGSGQYNIESWDSWKKDLEGSREQFSEEETKGLIVQALAAMEAVEKGN